MQYATYATDWYSAVLIDYKSLINLELVISAKITAV